MKPKFNLGARMIEDPFVARLSRMERVRSQMRQEGVDVLLLSLGADLPWISGYEAMPLERLTMLVIPADAEATLVVPRLEAPRVDHDARLFALSPWGELESPIEMVTKLVGERQSLAISDRCWATFLVDLQRELPKATWRQAGTVTAPVRRVKDAAEIAALVAASQAIDTVAAQLHAGEIPLIGRTEADVSADLSRRIVASGHQKVNFAIVAAGENAASPHHHGGSRVIKPNEVVLTDFGGTMNGYCSDITRCVFTGQPDAEFSGMYQALMASNRAGVAAGVVSAACQDVDRASRAVLDEAGYGEFFIHRTGHGIGMEEHEDPYMVEGNAMPIEAGNAFSVEPGVYIAGKWGARLEDIVIATNDGPMCLNSADRRLVSLDR